MSPREAIATALTSADKLTANAARELMNQARGRVADIHLRVAAIRPAKGLEPQGSERRKVLEAGDTETLASLDRELEALAAEGEVLRAQTDRLGTIIQDAHARECAQALPGLHRSMANALKRAEAARVAFESALADVDAAFVLARDARVHAEQRGHSVANAPTTLMQAIDALRPWTAPARSHIFRVAPGRLRESLGIADPEPLKPKQPEAARWVA